MGQTMMPPGGHRRRRRVDYHCPQGFCTNTGSTDSPIPPECRIHGLRMIPADVWAARWGKNRTGRP